MVIRYDLRMAKPREIQDRFFKQAKAEGYAARSAYKLKEIQERRRIINRGDRVVDLGCAPGSWVQVSSQIVGAKGFVVGIDLLPVRIDDLPNARTVEGDIYKVNAAELLALDPNGGNRLKLFDVVLSDMAPNTEGGAGGSGDHFRSIELCRRVLALAPKLLKPGGNLVMKVFEGEAYPDLLRETERMFAKGEVKGFKPESSREVSREMFVVAKKHRPPEAAQADVAPVDKHAMAPARPQPRAGWGT